MNPLYICSTAPQSGKSLLIMGLGFRLQEDGYKLGYLKPIGTNPTMVDHRITDSDAVFIKETLKLEEPLSQLCPVVLTHSLIQRAYQGRVRGLKERVLRAYEKLARGKDLVLIGGRGNLFAGGFIGLTGLDLAEALDSPTILVDSYRSDLLSIDYALDAQRFLGKRLLGVVLNRVPSAKMGYIQRKLAPFLERKAIMVLGLLPEDELLHSTTIRSLADALGAECIAGEAHLDRFVTRALIGAMTQEGAMRYLKHVKDSAIITGGDRVDIQLVSLEAGVGCIILTGGIRPNEAITARAEEKGTPIIVVNTDTFTVVEAFRQAMERLQIREESKIRRAADLVRANFDYQRLIKKLRLPRKRGSQR